MPETRVFEVKHYGAVGDGRHDDGPAIRQALADIARRSKTVGKQTLTLRFEPKRVYRIGAWDERWEALPLIEARNVVLDGRGCELSVHPKNMCFSILRCANITLRNFVIDYSPLPFSQGVVTAINPDGSFLWRLDAGYPKPHDPDWVAKEGQGYDHGCFTQPDGHYTHHWCYVQQVLPENLSAGIYRIIPRADMANVVQTNVQIGQRFWFFMDYNNKHEHTSRFKQEPNAKGYRVESAPVASIQLRYSPSCVVENITSYSSPRFTLRHDACDDLKIRNFKIMLRPGTNRICASNSDGIHGRSFRGPLIENCYFEALGDDNINMNNLPHRIWEVDSPRRLTLLYTEIGWYPSWLRTGYRIAFYDPTIKTIIAERRITSHEWDGLLSHITLDAPVEGLIPTDHTKPTSPTEVLAYLIPEGKAIVRGCEFRSQLKAACLVEGPLLIENNRMSDTAYGITCQGYITDLTFRNNTIEGAWPHAIGVTAVDGDPEHAKIRILNNKITMRDVKGQPVVQAIIINSQQAVEISGNTITLDANTPAQTVPIQLEHCAKVRMSRNRIMDKRAAPSQAEIVTIGMQTSQCELVDNQIQAAPNVTIREDR